MIKALASKGGVIQINFGSGFIDTEIQKQQTKFYRELKAELARQRLDPDSPKAKPVIEKYKQTHELSFATLEQVADHIDHVVKLAGIDHVGLGSDFDGVGDTLPTGLKDVSNYPNLIRVLLERGYSEPDIEKICSGNVLRVWQAVEDHAAAAQAEKAK
jgi:membrane dipeptidase